MAAIAGTMVSNILNATLPVGAAGIPGAWFTLSASPMKLRLNSGTSSASAVGTELTGTGYIAGGSAFTAASTPSAAGGNVTVPATNAMSWTNGGAAWTIASLDITDSLGARTWFGLFNAQPIAVGSGNTFQIAVGGVTVSLT